MTKSAFTQARSKLKASAFIEIRDRLNTYFEQKASHKTTFESYRVVAIDGTQLNLPSEEVLKEHFGSYSNQFQVASAGARASVAFDVCNKIVLDGQIGHLKSCEKEYVIEHIKNLNPRTDLLVFDRGYPCFWLVSFLEKHHFKYCFRLSTAWKKAHQALENTADIDWNLKVQDNTNGLDKIKKYELEKEISALRLVGIMLKSGEKEVLLTNLTDREVFTLDKMKKLYHLRWGIEECYKCIKQVLKVEFFSGRTVHAIEQDFQARILMFNIASMLESQSVNPLIKIKAKNAKHKIKPNFTQVVMKVKEFMVDIFMKNIIEQSIHKILKLLLNCYDIERLNRSFKRYKGHKTKQKPLNYKAL